MNTDRDKEETKGSNRNKQAKRERDRDKLRRRQRGRGTKMGKRKDNVRKMERYRQRLENIKWKIERNKVNER